MAVTEKHADDNFKIWNETNTVSKNLDNSQGISLDLVLSVPIMYLLTFITVAGNILVLISIFTQKKLRNCRSNRFLINLAIADLSVGIFVMLPSILKFQEGKWLWGASLCMFWVSLDVGFCSASIYCLIGISIDRFYAVYRPLSYVTRKRNTLTTNLLLIFSWLMAVLISLPMYVEKEGFSNWPTSVRNNSMEECIPPVEPSSTGYVIYAGLLAFIFPSIVLICLYAVIAHKMRETQQQRIDKAFVEVREEDENNSTTMKSSDKAAISKLLRETSKVEFSFAESSDIMIEELQGLPRMRDDTVIARKSQRESRTKRKYKRELNAQLRITIMMGVIISTFAVCWTPFAIMFISFPFGPDFWIEHYKWIDVITWIGYVNSCLNPVIYAIMNKQIRRGMLAICSRKRR